jgi:hypothetical protein
LAISLFDHLFGARFRNYNLGRRSRQQATGVLGAPIIVKRAQAVRHNQPLSPIGRLGLFEKQRGIEILVRTLYYKSFSKQVFFLLLNRFFAKQKRKSK